jgi:CHAD domain-containing protein
VAYCIDSEKELSRELVRVVREECRRIVARSRARSRVGEAVHEIRQATKRLRAIARLLRPRLGESAFRSWNDGLRDAARELAEVRDAEVILASLQEIARPRDPRDARLLRAFRGRAAEARKHAVSSGALRRVGDAVKRLEPRLAASIPDGLRARDLEPGLREAFQRARSQWKRAAKRPDDESLHELRKREKIVRAHAELLRPEARRLLRDLEELSDLLGEDHDLVVLRAALGCQLGEAHHLIPRIDRRRASLQRKAMKLASKLFAERPKGFARRLLG